MKDKINKIMKELITNMDKKKEVWKQIKPNLLKAVPEHFEIRVDGLESDSEYFHPEVIIDENTTIRGQTDINTDYIYGWYVIFKFKVKDVFRTHTVRLENEYLQDFLNNKKLRDEINKTIEVAKKITLIKIDLTTAQDLLLSDLVEKSTNKIKLRQSVRLMEKSIEIIENRRLC